jgi:hypothetical protein
MIYRPRIEWDALRQALAGEETEIEPCPEPWVVPVLFVVEGGQNATSVQNLLRPVLAIHVVGPLRPSEDPTHPVVTGFAIGEPRKDPALRRRVKT